MSDWSSDVCSSDLFDRSTDEEMVVEISGRWCEYRLFFVWQEDLSAMYFSCLFDLRAPAQKRTAVAELLALVNRSEEHTSELQSLMRISYAVFCLKKKKHIYNTHLIQYYNITYNSSD